MREQAVPRPARARRTETLGIEARELGGTPEVSGEILGQWNDEELVLDSMSPVFVYH